MYSLYVWLYEGCLSSAIEGPLEVFSVANEIWLQDNPQGSQVPFHVELQSIDGLPVKTVSGRVFNVSSTINSDQTIPDVLLLPGIQARASFDDLLATLDEYQSLHPLLRTLHRQGVLMAANCSASFLLADAGLLDSGHATTSNKLEGAFRERYPNTQLHLDKVLTEHDRVLCSGPASSFVDLALHVVDRLVGHELADAVANRLLLEPRSGSRLPHMAVPQLDWVSHSDPIIARSQQWLMEYGSRACSLKDLALYLQMSERTVIRRFRLGLDTTPSKYIQQYKIELMKRLLSSTDMSFDAVVQNVGYSDVSTCRRLFRRSVGKTPSEYRRALSQ
jgi:transcriptional regulator GlxA family with amidase domain